MRPRQHGRSVLTGLCWLYGRSKFPTRKQGDQQCEYGHLKPDTARGENAGCAPESLKLPVPSPQADLGVCSSGAEPNF